MDPDNPIRPVNDASLTHVQRWVLSVLAVFTIGHMAVGLVIAAMYARADDPSARIGLNVLAGLFGVMAVGTARLIHRRSPLTAWLLLGLLPGIVGLVLVLR